MTEKSSLSLQLLLYHSKILNLDSILNWSAIWVLVSEHHALVLNLRSHDMYTARWHQSKTISLSLLEVKAMISASYTCLFSHSRKSRKYRENSHHVEKSIISPLFFLFLFLNKSILSVDPCSQLKSKRIFQVEYSIDTYSITLLTLHLASYIVQLRSTITFLVLALFSVLQQSILLKMMSQLISALYFLYWF